MAAHGVDDAMLAEAVGELGVAAHRSTISRIRRGKQAPAPELAAAITRATRGAVHFAPAASGPEAA